MKAEIHPNYHPTKVTCSCGNHFTVGSTYSKDELSLEICGKCHPFYTGERTKISASGRVDKFRKRYQKKETGTAA